MARMCEPRLGIWIQGRIRNLGLSTTRGRFFSRSCGVHPMNLSRGASFQAAVELRSRAWRRAIRRGRGRRSASGRRPGSCIRDSDSGRRTRSTACLSGAARDGAHLQRADFVEGSRGREQRGSVSGSKTIGRGRPCCHFGGGRAIRPSSCMASMVTLAIMSLRSPSGLSQPLRHSFPLLWRPDIKHI